MMHNEILNPTPDELERGSWVVVEKNRKPTLIFAGWVPGYTKAHKQTKTEAIQFAIAKREELITELNLEMSYLQTLIEDPPEVPNDESGLEVPTYEDGTPYFGRDLEEWRDSLANWQVQALADDRAMSNGAPDVDLKARLAPSEGIEILDELFEDEDDMHLWTHDGISEPCDCELGTNHRSKPKSV